MQLWQKTALALSFIFGTALAYSAHPVDKPQHITFSDSAHKKELHINAQLLDSVAITNLTNAKTHYDNSMSVRFFANGKFTDDFLFDARVKINTDHTNRYINFNYYNPDEGLPYNKQSENKRTWDLFAANVSYNLKPVKLLAGFDFLEWGPARRNHVILRGERNFYRPWQDSSSRIPDAAPTPYFGYQFTLGPIEYTQYAAKIYEKKNFGKYFHAHRLNLNLPKDITFGISETALYGSTIEPAGSNPNPDSDSTEREFEWAYAIPFIPFVFQEHLQGDQDNISLAFDLSVKTIPNWEFYGELMWDDMKSLTSMFDDSWWGNKWAATLGVARDNIVLGPATLGWMFEYTRIEPWVYTHHKGRAYTYASYAQSLGSDLGPNSQEIHTEVSATYEFLKATLYLGAVAKDTAFGGRINDLHTPESAMDKKFLSKKTTIRYKELGFNMAATPWDWFSFRCSYTRFFGDYEGYRAYAVGSVQW
ncbi:MAG: hypothetical protein IKS97_04145 [Fibrobacter sp.]|nr:hypothetical protein [Fibrobacter sp.]